MKQTQLHNGRFLGLLLMFLMIFVVSNEMRGTATSACNLGCRSVQAVAAAPFPHQTGTLWSPYLEWSVTNNSYSGNPFDLIATVTFTHNSSGEIRTTEMFYDGNNIWKFRFAGTRIGDYSFTTSSSDGELNGLSGTISISDNPGDPGFVTWFGDKWGRVGDESAFVPQYVMASAPQNYYNNPTRIDDEIQTFIVEHGFNGFNTPVFCRWFDINQPKCGLISDPDPNPDIKTFEALELLITKTYDAGGVVHIWMWGDDASKQNPNFLPGGLNGAVDQRLQRYIAARLGPLPGWTASYGYDLFEWVNESELTQWHDTMQAKLGWPHLLGARANKNQLNQISEAMDYSSYEQHRPDYNKYAQTIAARPTKPSFSEDRFRIRTTGGTPSKDYTMVTTRQGLWDSAMAGGVGNIWGNLTGDTSSNDGSDTSLPYSNPTWIKTYSQFFTNRFTLDLVSCNELTNGVCLKRPNNNDFIFYGENVSSLQLELSGMSGKETAVAVDALSNYTEIPLGQLNPTNQTWTAPYTSDWAIAIGDFTEPPCVPANNFSSNTASSLPLSTVGSLAYHTYLPIIMNDYCS